jgi:conjugative transfer region protein TrbK
MNMRRIERIPRLAALVLVVLAVAACEIPLRDADENANRSAPTDITSDPLATKLAECRSVTYEQKDALSECRKVWSEKRSQFLERKSPAHDAPPAGSSSIAVKDQSRLNPVIHRPGRSETSE